jgi:putative FmdB family regulatory protein
MPIYEYRCKDCGKEFEVIQQFGDGQLRKCRECSGKLEKLISRTAFRLKGGGWYDDGYGGGSGGGAKKKPSTTTTDSSSSGTAKKKPSSSPKKD